MKKTMVVDGKNVEVYVDKNGSALPEGAKYGYVADTETANAFRNVLKDAEGNVVTDNEGNPIEQGIPLIRNWVKIELTAKPNSHFTPISLAVVNVPTRGSIAPYCGSINYFIENYQDKSFTQLEELNYLGTLPTGTTFDSTIPDKEDFEYFKDNQHQDETMKGNVANAKTGAAFLYERPSPTDQQLPSYVIIYGTYDGDGKNYFYKVDLMETVKVSNEEGKTVWNSHYYPLYRNFKYEISVNLITSKGFDTPVGAAASAGSADVSTDINTGHLSDISDGFGRLHVTPWMAHTFTKAYDDVNNPFNELSVYFSKSTDGEPDMDEEDVTVELLPPKDGGTDIINNLTLYKPSNPGHNDDNWPWESDDMGWRRITFNTIPLEEVTMMRQQTIRITGYYSIPAEEGSTEMVTGRLYRDVVIAIQPIQPLLVSCLPRIAGIRGTSQEVTIQIPDGLGESMFPLDFTIEAVDLTLTPDNSVPNNSLPVISEPSSAEGHSQLTFKFVKTLTLDEYRNLPRVDDNENEFKWRTFTCYFKTNKDKSATTIFVTNPYFITASDHFTNFNHKYFKDLAFTTPIPRDNDKEIMLNFELIKDDAGIYPQDFPQITIIPSGLTMSLLDEVIGGSDLHPSEETEGAFQFTPIAADGKITLKFKTTTDDGNVTVRLKADEYDEGILRPFRFNRSLLSRTGEEENIPAGSSYGILSCVNGSNAAYGRINSGYQSYNKKYGKGKKVFFGYFDDPDALNAPISLFVTNYTSPTDNRVTLNNTTAANITNMYVTTGSGSEDWIFGVAPSGPLSNEGAMNYHEVVLKTDSKTDNYQNKLNHVFFILSAPGYIEEHFSADRFQGRVHTNSFLLSDANPTSRNDGSLTFSYYNSGDFGYCRYTIEPLNGSPAVYYSSTNPAGVVLGRNQNGSGSIGGQYRITVTTEGAPGSYTSQTLLSSIFRISPSYSPDLSGCSSDEGEEFYLYPGSNNQYIWAMPDVGSLDNSYIGSSNGRKKTSSMIFSVGTQHPVCIERVIFRSYSDTPDSSHPLPTPSTTP